MPTSSLSARVAEYLDSHTTIGLATEGPSGLWAAAVLYVRQGAHLYFTSVPDTRHALNLAANRRAAGTIHDDCHSWAAMKGIQFEGHVDVVREPGELLRVVTAYLARFPFAAGMWKGQSDPAVIARDPGRHGFYQITVTRLHFMDNEHHPEGREELAPTQLA